MVNATLHYYYDPLCGWCYGASPLLQAAAALPGLTLALHAGGMMSGDARRPVSHALRQYVMQHDMRIQAQSGQPFGQAYFDGLLRDEGAVLDSTPPTLAIMAAAALGVPPLTMLARIQRAHYVEGQRIAEPATLQALATGLGLDAAAFQAEMQRQGERFPPHVANSRADMARHGLYGFPSLLLELDGRVERIDVGAFLGRPQDFVQALAQRLGGEAAVADEAPASFCTPDGCA